MGWELQSLRQVETKKLLWIMGVTFALVVTFQYLELPYSISSLFSANKIPVATNSSLEIGVPLSKPKTLGYANSTSSVNSTDLSPAPVVAGNNVTSEGNDIHVDDCLGPKRNDDSNRSSGFNETVDRANQTPFGRLGKLSKNSTADDSEHLDNSTSALAPKGFTENDHSSLASEGSKVNEQSFLLKNDTVGGRSVEGDDDEEETPVIFDSSGNQNGIAPSSALALPPAGTWSPEDVNKNGRTPFGSIGFNSSLGEKDSPPISHKNEKTEQLQKNLTTSVNNTSATSVPDVKKSPELPVSGVVTIAEMRNLLLHNRASHLSKKPRWVSEADQELLYAKRQIDEIATIYENDPSLYAPLYRNVSRFKRSYELMETMLKVYVYKEGKRPVMHVPVLKGIYASEGWFMKLLESNTNFLTKNPRKAHLFYLPFSSRMLEETLYVQNSHSHDNLIQFLKGYLDLIAGKYPFWNRTAGADHFLVACHDWAPAETRKYMANCIRALCNSDVKEGFVFGKDVALPETNVHNSQKPLRDLGGKPASQRPILAFFAGKMHGYLRPILLSYWGDNKDPDIKVFGKLPRSKGNKNYNQFMKTSKYCICAKGYEVNSPRVVEAIFFECVPVIISDNFVPPFFEILNWESFAVFVLEKDIPNLKNILRSIPEKRYRDMQMRVKKVQKHFLWHAKPEKYDMFHMILHSVWYNRVFQIWP